MDALTFAEWQREQDDEVWARFAPIAVDSPTYGGCGCFASRVLGGDCAHTAEDPDEELEPTHVHEPCTEEHLPTDRLTSPDWLVPHCRECGEPLEQRGSQYCADQGCSRPAQHTGEHFYPTWMEEQQ